MARSTSVTKIREIIKLYENGINSFRAIGRALNIDHEVTARIIRAASNLNLTYIDIKDMQDDYLYKLFYPKNTNIKYNKAEVNVDKVVEELRKHKTLTI